MRGDLVPLLWCGFHHEPTVPQVTIRGNITGGVWEICMPTLSADDTCSFAHMNQCSSVPPTWIARSAYGDSSMVRFLLGQDAFQIAYDHMWI